MINIGFFEEIGFDSCVFEEGEKKMREREKEREREREREDGCMKSD